MKNLLLAVGDKTINTVTMDFACYLARLTKSSLTGIFPKTIAHKERLVTALSEDSLHMPMSGNDEGGAEDSAKERISRFEDACTSRNIVPDLHTPISNSWDDLIEATRYADAVIIDSDFTLHEHILEANPTHWAKKLLHESACPVIVAPLSFDTINEVIFTYDGSNSSLFAIREFLHIFPELVDTKATVLQVWLEDDERPKEQHQLIRWVKSQVNTVESVVLEATSNERLTEYLLSHPGALITMGGFGRGRMSRILQPSASGSVARLVSSPLFIAHN
jgi:hypothetical protein